jgi:DNA polymerase-3 subunit beta
MATDLDLQVVETMGAVSVEPGRDHRVGAPAVRYRAQAARWQPGQPRDGRQPHDGQGRAQPLFLPTLPRDDFPMIVEGELPTSFELPAATLAQLIDRTRFAISTEETRYYLNGIFLHVTDEELKAAATDGHRLARFTIPPRWREGMPDVIVPRKCVAELRKLLEEALDTNVEIDLSASQDPLYPGRRERRGADQQADRRHVPRLQPRHPDRQRQAAAARSRSFYEGVDRVATIATEKTRAVKMALDTDKVTLSVTSPDNGTAAEELPADYNSAGFEIGFNANYLKDILGQIDGDTVELHLADAGAPTLIRQDEKSPALYVLMPMRV